jgi:hypothetical protein
MRVILETKDPAAAKKYTEILETLCRSVLK